jgi:GTPase
MLGLEKNFLLVSIVTHNLSQKEAFNNIHELIQLVETYGGGVEDIILQNREVHDKGHYIGKGKIEEVKESILAKGIEVVVLNDVIKPGQIYFLQSYFEKFKKGIQVWDRVDLILKIFSKHANTAEAKLQIELAAMRHMGPRIYGMGDEMSRQGGIIGTRGIGETNTERMKRHWRVQMKKTKRELEKLVKARQLKLDKRKKAGLATISLVGYTNAGKTSLFNILTQKKRLVKNSLFVTLDSSVGRVYIKKLGKEILLSDTIGFIQNLPPELIEAFKSTLLESINSDLLLHVIDSTDTDMEKKIATVEDILKGLSIDNKKRIYVFNKIDKRTSKNFINGQFSNIQPVFTSVKTGVGIEELKEIISSQLNNKILAIS